MFSSASLVELSSRLQALSISNKRSFHASCRCLATAKPLHALPGQGSKGLTNKTSAGGYISNGSANTNVQANKTDLEKAREELIKGGLAPNSIFADELTAPPPPPKASKGKQDEIEHEIPRNPESLAHVLNPKPRARAMWQRKMLVRSLQKRGRLTKSEKTLQLERFHLSKSPFFKTSIKKLAPLARQIAGKTIDEAILQMRFSVKKAAQDVRDHLIRARNEAIITKGMGLNSLPPSLPLPFSKSTTAVDVITTDTSVLPVSQTTHNPTLSLKRSQTTPETQIYIAQAWVNRGPYDQELECRARGQANMLRPPHTGISVLLKEEKTRMREKEEKEGKDKRRRLGKSLWKQLPDRKVYGQRGYYTW